MKINLFKISVVIIAILGFYFLMNPGIIFNNKSDEGFIEIELDLSEYESAIFAGGCFWCMETAFEKLPGVFQVSSGYTGGKVESPSYQEVVSGNTGHKEAIIVYYLPEMISYDTLLEVFWMNIDPTDDGGQFADRGSSYKTAIFYNDDSQKEAAEESKNNLAENGPFEEPIVTEILESKPFYLAELYHQDYYIKNDDTFGEYRLRSPRTKFTESIWGEKRYQYDKTYQKPDQNIIKERLTPIQYKVTQENGTETPFENSYFDNVEAKGIYVDIVSGEPLFSSQDMFLSGTGWPSFTKPLVPMHILYKTDNSGMTSRIEVRSKFADSHLGHVFTEESELPCRRYCINSAALRFIPLGDLEKEGYSEFLTLFNNNN